MSRNIDAEVGLGSVRVGLSNVRAALYRQVGSSILEKVRECMQDVVWYTVGAEVHGNLFRKINDTAKRSKP